ncbi:MAG: hypothetical protein ACTTKL_02305 [Treponema sp.]
MGVLDFLSADYGLKKYKSGVYAGVLEGFYTVFQIEASERKCAVTIGVAQDNEDEALLTLLQERLKLVKKVKAWIEPAKFVVEYPIPALGNHKQKFNAVIKDIVIPFLMEKKYQSGGFLHGKNDGTIRLFQIGARYAYLTESERSEVEADLINQKETEKNTQENILFGILGVIGVALAGILVYVLVGRLNLYVWAIPAVLSAAAYRVYKRLGKKLSVKAIVMIFIVLCIALIAATVLEYGWRIYDVVNANPNVEPLSFFDVLKETPELMLTEPDIAKPVRRDLLVNGGVLILASIFTMVSAYRQEVRFLEIKRAD